MIIWTFIIHPNFPKYEAIFLVIFMGNLLPTFKLPYNINREIIFLYTMPKTVLNKHNLSWNNLIIPVSHLI
jgi:hypothetical protein